MLPIEVLQKYQNLTPTLLDCVCNYSDGVGANNNVLGGYGVADHNNFLLPQGVHPLSTATSTLNTLISTSVNDSWTLTFSVDTIEPIICSPFMWAGESYNNAGLYGINAFNVICNLDSSMKRFWSKSLPTGTCTLSFTANAISNAQLRMNFLTSQPTQAIIPKNIIPYYDYTRYLLGSAQTAVMPVSDTASTTFTFSSIQFNVMPDVILIYCRKAISAQTCKDAEAFFLIDSISINFNAIGGLLSSALPSDLWKMSVASGIQQNFPCATLAYHLIIY
jgi:hypothetical protein